MYTIQWEQTKNGNYKGFTNGANINGIEKLTVAWIHCSGVFWHITAAWGDYESENFNSAAKAMRFFATLDLTQVFVNPAVTALCD